MGNFFSELFGTKEAPKKEEEKRTPEAEAAPKKEEDKRTPVAETEREDDKVVQPTEADDKYSYARQLLKAQNDYRKKHGVDPLTLNKEMCDEAQIWANELMRKNTLQHSDTNLGENLAMASPELKADKAAQMWYDEVKKYNFGDPGFKSGTGHFTQVVWKGSKEFGCGMAQGSSGGVYVVGRYSPAGNVLDHFQENVYPAK